jgi:hypothetical protein
MGDGGTEDKGGEGDRSIGGGVGNLGGVGEHGGIGERCCSPIDSLVLVSSWPSGRTDS